MTSDDGRRIGRCSECGHTWTLPSGTAILEVMRNKKGKIIGYIVACEQCQGRVFVPAT
jgi:DNA-directed RNA polymerase subunit RPC12/RpoP